MSDMIQLKNPNEVYFLAVLTKYAGDQSDFSAANPSNNYSGIVREEAERLVGRRNRSMIDRFVDDGLIKSDRLFGLMPSANEDTYITIDTYVPTLEGLSALEASESNLEFADAVSRAGKYQRSFDVKKAIDTLREVEAAGEDDPSTIDLTTFLS